MRLSQIEGYFQALDRIKDSGDLLSLLLEANGAGPIRGIFIARLPSPDESISPNILLRGWNDEWISVYAQKSYVRDDPIAKELSRRNSAFVWSEVCRSRKLSNVEQTIMREARSAGLEDGLTVPILDGSLRTTCVSFSTTGAPIGEYFDNERRQTLQTVASMAVAKLESLNPAPPAPHSLIQNLAPREAQCLALAGKGLTSRQIERQTGLSCRTIDFYIGRAIQKLNASNRTEAVNLAQKHRMIST